MQVALLVVCVYLGNDTWVINMTQDDWVWNGVNYAGSD